MIRKPYSVELKSPHETVLAKVALVMHHPAQQFAEPFRLLAEAKDLRPNFLYWTADVDGYYDEEFHRWVKWDVDLTGGYDWWVPPGRGLRKAIRLANRLRCTGPTAVICYGWSDATAWVAIITCILGRVPLFLTGDSTWQHRGRRSRRLFRWIALRLLFKLVRGAIATGTFNREFYISLGMDPRHIAEGVCPVDVTTFEMAGRDARPRDGGIMTIGFAGKLTYRKGVDELLRALAIVPGSWRAEIVGDGPDRESLESLRNELGLQERVQFVGFLNTSEMPAFLANCDIVVVPSRRDLRTLITAEAMAAGAAVIVSTATAVWGAGDLVSHRVTGLLFKSGNVLDLARQIRCLLEDQELRSSVQRSGVLAARHQDGEAFVEGVRRAIRLLEVD